MSPLRATFGSTVDVNALVQAYIGHFGLRPRVFQSPARLNIIGDHTDYSGGFALPAAFDKSCYVACAQTGGQHLSVMSRNKGEMVTLPLDRYAPLGHWSDYVSAVAQTLRSASIPVTGAALWIDSEIPVGAGVSSSAALEVAVASALLASAGVSIDRHNLAAYASEAERRYVGVPSGPLDPIASVFAKRDQALMLDCHSLSMMDVPWPSSAALVLFDSLVTHSHASGAYSDRRAECNEAASRLNLTSLRDATASSSDDARLSPVLRQRVRHVYSENARVLAAAKALRNNGALEVGRLMRESHESLRIDFDVTCAETDLLAGLANDTPGVWGARQMGGGFGGCVLAVCDVATAPRTALAVVSAYAQRTGLHLPWHICTLTDGAREIVL